MLADIQGIRLQVEALSNEKEETRELTVGITSEANELQKRLDKLQTSLLALQSDNSQITGETVDRDSEGDAQIPSTYLQYEETRGQDHVSTPVETTTRRVNTEEHRYEFQFTASAQEESTRRLDERNTHESCVIREPDERLDKIATPDEGIDNDNDAGQQREEIRPSTPPSERKKLVLQRRSTGQRLEIMRNRTCDNLG